MAKKKPTKPKRLVRGRDWHGWMWELPDGELVDHCQTDIGRWEKPTWKPDQHGEWVRVCFKKV